LCRSVRKTTGKQYRYMRATFAVGRRPGTRNHEIPGIIALLPGSRSQTANADETQTGRSFIIFYQSCLNLKMYDFFQHPRCRNIRDSQNQSIIFSKKRFTIMNYVNCTIYSPSCSHGIYFFDMNCFSLIPNIMYYILKLFK